MLLDTDNILFCPNCGETCLHRTSVQVFEIEEGMPGKLHVSVERDRVLVDNDLSHNPGFYRKGVAIHFECDACEAKPVLELHQHEDNTYMNFRICKGY